MKITEVKTKLYEWTGETVPPAQHFCTNAMDALYEKADPNQDTMSSFRFHNWLVVEIHTDTGDIGIGNAALAPPITKAVIDTYLKKMLIGANPFDYEYLWQKMYRSTLAFGRKGVVLAAISAVDIAIWDVMGKILKMPVFQLLGGKVHDKIRVYASKLYASPLDELQAEAKKYVDEGYTAFKMRFGWGQKDGALGMKQNLELVETVREVIGYDADLMCEAYMGWDLDYAKRMLPKLKEYKIRWLEEPVIADDIGGYAHLSAMNLVPIAGGEHEFTIYGFKDLLERKAVDYVQFDTNRVGGITQAKKICTLAEAYQIPVIPHAGQMHNFHIVASSIISPMAEYFPVHAVEIGNELFWYIFEGEPKPEQGFIHLDDHIQGLGLTLSTKYLNQFNITE